MTNRNVSERKWHENFSNPKTVKRIQPNTISSIVNFNNSGYKRGQKMKRR